MNRRTFCAALMLGLIALPTPGYCPPAGSGAASGSSSNGGGAHGENGRSRPQMVRGAFGGRKTRWHGVTPQSWSDSRNAPEAGQVGPVGR